MTTISIKIKHYAGNLHALRSLGVLALAALTFTSCSDIMDVDSDRVAYENNHNLSNANDSIYSVMGVLSQIQNIADRCVLMGELRGDLMTTDANNASTDLQEIEHFNISSTNKYGVRRDFYNIINNCNYIIARMDTSLTENTTKVMVPEYAQVKTLRAWTYMQMALVFGKVNYFTKPLLTIDDIGSQTTTMTIDQLAQTLISDLEPIADARPLDYGTVDGWNSAEFFLPAKMLLGDLYLYDNQYDKAAEAYYSLINSRHLTVSSNYSNYWNSPTRDDINSSHIAAYRNDVITRIAFDASLRSYHSQIGNLTYSENPALLPASWFTNEMSIRPHFHTDGVAISRFFNGDLRGFAQYANGKILPDAFGETTVGTASKRMLITKFYNNLNGSATDKLEQRPLTSIAICRPSMVYLRYAEALNRLGKPTIAYAVLKYGLKQSTLNDTLKVDSNEVKNLPAYISFPDNIYNGNIGTAAHGCGLGVKYDQSQYVIPANADTTQYVEECILQEMAAESCFEGNRFFDLLCVSRHRADHPAFIARRVSEKFVNGEAMRQRLLDMNNWWAK